MNLRRALVGVCVFVLLAGLVLGTAGCGGGGSSGPPSASPALLAGPQHYLAVGGGSGPPLATLALWGAASADGLGTLSVGPLSQNVDGVVSAGAPFNLSYRVAADRRLALDDALGTLAEGAISSAGDVVATAITRTGSLPALMLLLEQGSGLGNGHLAGAYHYFSHLAFSGSAYLLWGSATCDGSGNYVRDVQGILGGVSTGTLSAPGLYTVASDGGLTLDLEQIGGLQASGDFALLTFPTTTQLPPIGGVGLVVLVRKSASASLSTLAGAYGLSGRMIEVPSGAQSVQTGTASVTAPGLLSATFSSNREGVVSAPASGAMNFAVAPDGAMAFVGDDYYVGAVAPDGRFAVMLGGITYGADAQIVLLVR